MATRLRANGKKTCVIDRRRMQSLDTQVFRVMGEQMPTGSSGVRFLRHEQESTLIKIPSDVATVGLATSKGSVHNVLP